MATGGIKNVTNSTVNEVMEWAEGLEAAFGKFTKWLNEQKFNSNERIIADTIFNLRFASLPMSALTRAGTAKRAVGEARNAEIRELVKKFSVDSKFCSEAGFDDPDVDD